MGGVACTLASVTVSYQPYSCCWSSSAAEIDSSHLSPVTSHKIDYTLRWARSKTFGNDYSLCSTTTTSLTMTSPPCGLHSRRKGFRMLIWWLPLRALVTCSRRMWGTSWKVFAVVRPTCCFQWRKTLFSKTTSGICCSVPSGRKLAVPLTAKYSCLYIQRDQHLWRCFTLVFGIFKKKIKRFHEESSELAAGWISDDGTERMEKRQSRSICYTGYNQGFLSLPECHLLAPGVIYISKNNISCQFLYGYKVKVILSHWALSHHITHELCLKCAVNVCASYWWQIYDTDQVVLRY